MRHHSTSCTPTAPPRGVVGSPSGCLRQSWQSPPAGLFHLLPYPTATGCPLAPQKQRPARAPWVLPCRLASLLQPSSRHLRDWRATLPPQPSQGVGLTLTCWTFPACRIKPRATGSVSSGDRFRRWTPFSPSQGRDCCLPSSIPAYEPVCPFSPCPPRTPPQSPTPGSAPPPCLLPL